ncbi:MAG: transporter substrate-binding domain-containing protein [Alphaproteobacteria bacterium]|nr:transporter substrate-binding domain-containing protein [Alphaproteobacteria bacterium]
MRLYTKLIAGAIMASVSSFSPVWAGEALDRVMNKGVLTVATDANWAPQSFLNDNNKMDGFDVDVAKEIARRMGVGIKFVTPSWTIITAGKWAGRWDISVGSMTPTKARGEVLSFPGIYYFTPASFAVQTDSPITDKLQLNGKTICATTASTYELYLQHDLTIDAIGTPPFKYDVTPGKISSMKDTSTCLNDVRLGAGVRVDGMIGSLPALVAAKKAGLPIRVVGTPAFYEPLSVAIDKGDTEFDAKLGKIIAAMHADGTLSKMSMKWYGIDYSAGVK